MREILMLIMELLGTVSFAVSGAFTFAGHLAFTLAYNADYLPAMIVGKLSAGILAVVVGMFLYKRNYEK